MLQSRRAGPRFCQAQGSGCMRGPRSFPPLRPLPLPFLPLPLEVGPVNEMTRLQLLYVPSW